MKQKLKPLFFLVFTFLYVISFGQYNLKDPLPIDKSVKIGKLSNGLTYYIRKNAKPEKKLELRLAVNAGSVPCGGSRRVLRERRSDDRCDLARDPAAAPNSRLPQLPR